LARETLLFLPFHYTLTMQDFYSDVIGIITDDQIVAYEFLLTNETTKEYEASLVATTRR
jgi:hypothetical protein